MDGELLAPSRMEMEQRLKDNLPIVITTSTAKGLKITSEAFAIEEGGEEWVLEEIGVENTSEKAKRTSLYISVRPYNPEGVSLIKTIKFKENAFFVNGNLGVVLPKPDGVACSNLRRGDVSLHLPDLDGSISARCEAGLATGVVEYKLELKPGERRSVVAKMPMRKGIKGKPISPFGSIRDRTIEIWREKLSKGMRISIPDARLQACFDANKAFLLLMHDGETITPGPFTYHHFWFRDAAYLVNALDKMGYHDEAREVLSTYPRRQRRDGFFISQNGEWDSCGQAIWTLVEHYKLTEDRGLLEEAYPSIVRGVKWIEKKREWTKKELGSHYGLLPPGFSAEHLGPNDYFYWDDFWCAAGERDAAYAANALGESEDAARFEEAFHDFWRDIEDSLAMVEGRMGLPIIPASPYRRMDSGAIGSLVALYPLRLLSPEDERIKNTIKALKERSFVEGVFFQQMGHSAFGTYLSLHVAECHIFQRSQEAWPIIRWILDHASQTYTWAEGINPLTRCGGMGDGHHGWAIADWLLLVRNLFLFEEGNSLVLTPVLPEEWLAEGNVVRVEDAPTYFGRMSFSLAFSEGEATLELETDFRRPPERIELNLPIEIESASPRDAEIEGKVTRFPPRFRKVVVRYKR